MACAQGHAVFLPPRKGGPTQNSPVLEEEPELPRLQRLSCFYGNPGLHSAQVLLKTVDSWAGLAVGVGGWGRGRERS